jgi:hypothetical protein
VDEEDSADSHLGVREGYGEPQTFLLRAYI